MALLPPWKFTSSDCLDRPAADRPSGLCAGSSSGSPMLRLTSVPSTVKCSSLVRPLACACASTAPRNSRATSPSSNRFRFFGEYRGVPHRRIQVHPDEPSEQHAVIDLFHQQPFAPDRVQHLNQLRAQQLLRWESTVRPVLLRTSCRIAPTCSATPHRPWFAPSGAGQVVGSDPSPRARCSCTCRLADGRFRACRKDVIKTFQG